MKWVVPNIGAQKGRRVTRRHGGSCLAAALMIGVAAPATAMQTAPFPAPTPAPNPASNPAPSEPAPPEAAAPEAATTLPPELEALLDPNAPLDPLPGTEVAWPEGTAPPAEQQATAPATPTTPATAPTEPAAPVIVATPDAPVTPVVLPEGLEPPPFPAFADGSPAPDGPPPVTDAMLAAEQAASEEIDAATLLAGASGDASRRYRVALTGVDDIRDDEFDLRFDELSTLEEHIGEDANIAQLRIRANQDEKLVQTLLRNKGYYDSFVTSRIGLAPDGKRLLVTLQAIPGPRYSYSAVNLPGIEAAGTDAPALRDAFGVKVGDTINADTLVLARQSLRDAMGEAGYPFHTLGEELVTIDHATRDGALDQPVNPGKRYAFGRVYTVGTDMFGTGHLSRIARFDKGDIYRATLQEDLRAALVATGLVSSVSIEPIPSADGEHVDLAVTVAKAPPRTIAGEVGYDTGEGFRAEASWTHRNLFPPEGALTVRGVAGTKEQLAGVTFRRNNAGGRDRQLMGQLIASHQDRDAFKALTATLAGSYERKTTLLFQKEWTWSFGGELTLTSERPKTAGVPRREYYVGAIPLMLGYDGSDDLLDPSRGFRVTGRVSPEFSFGTINSGYARIQLDASGYWPMSDRIVIAGRTRLAGIAGAERAAIAPSRLLYAGGGGSVRGYVYQGVGPRDANNVPLGGRSLTELSLEARIKINDIFGVVPFVDAGHISTSTVPKFKDFSLGAGIGARYYSPFGPVRVDLGTPIRRRPGDPWIAVYVSLGQAF